jgi:hypothetical protein
MMSDVNVVEREPDSPGVDRYQSDTIERRQDREQASRETVERANAQPSRRDAGQDGERKSSLREEVRRNFDEQARKEARAEQREQVGRAKVTEQRQEQERVEEGREAARPKTVRASVEDALEQATKTKPEPEQSTKQGAGTGDHGEWLASLPQDLRGVIEPHMATIAEAGVAPAVALQRLLEWHEGLRRDPEDQLPKLMAAMGLDPQQFGGGQEFQQVVSRHKEAFDDAISKGAIRHPAEGVGALLQWHDFLRRDPQLGAAMLLHQFGLDPSKPLLTDDVRQRWQQHVQQQQVQAFQQQAQTQGVVENWGQSKKYFTTVRGLMGRKDAWIWRNCTTRPFTLTHPCGRR